MRSGTRKSPSSRFWRPDPSEPALLSWWQPLVRAARRAVTEEVLWLILVDEWRLVGRYGRSGRPDVWIYADDRSGGELYVDESGQPYRFIEYRSGPSLGRFKEIDIRTAVWRSGLPRVGRGVSWGPPPRRSWEDEEWDGYDDGAADWQPPPAAAGPTGRPLLRLVSGADP